MSRKFDELLKKKLKIRSLRETKKVKNAFMDAIFEHCGENGRLRIYDYGTFFLGERSGICYEVPYYVKKLKFKMCNSKKEYFINKDKERIANENRRS